jgi:hypothetical protein
MMDMSIARIHELGMGQVLKHFKCKQYPLAWEWDNEEGADEDLIRTTSSETTNISQTMEEVLTVGAVHYIPMMIPP